LDLRGFSVGNRTNLRSLPKYHQLYPLERFILGLINPKNLDDNECFRWCHVRKLNPQKKDPQRIKLTDKEFVKKLDYSGVTFPVQYKDYNKIEKQNQINVNVIVYIGFFYPIHVSKEKNSIYLDLLYIEEGEKSHYVLIQDFDRLKKRKVIIR